MIPFTVRLPLANLNWKQQCLEHCCAGVCGVYVILPSLGAGHFFPYLFSSLNCLHSTKFCQHLHQWDPIKGKWAQCSSFTNAHNLNCTAVGQSRSHSALGTFLGRKKKINYNGNSSVSKSWIWSVLLTTIPPTLLQPPRGHHRDCDVSSTPCSTCHSHHTSQHRKLSLAAEEPLWITIFHFPIDLHVFECRISGFWLDANCFLQFSFTCGLHHST